MSPRHPTQRGLPLIPLLLLACSPGSSNQEPPTAGTSGDELGSGGTTESPGPSTSGGGAEQGAGGEEAVTTGGTFGELSTGGRSPMGGSGGTSGDTSGGGSGGSGAAGAGGASAPSMIRPGYRWTAHDGEPVRAIGGDIFEEDGTYYWYGATFDPEHLGTDPESDWYQPIFEYINCYSSSDLVHWTNHGAVFTYDDLRAALGPDLDDPYSVWVGRPGAWKNAEDEYVINFGFLSYPNFLEGEGNARNQVAALSASAPTGPFAWEGYQKLLGTHTFNDNSVFNDVDGNDYFIVTPVRELALEGDPDSDWQGTMITRLGPSGYFPTELVAHYPKLWSIEAPSLLHHKDSYYMYASDLHGWYNGNSSRMQSASSLSTFVDDMAAMDALRFFPETDWAYDSQIDFVLAAGDQLIYAGDRWSMWTGRGDGENIWLPMTSPRDVQWHDEWSIDLSSGSVSAPNAITNGSFEAMGPVDAPNECVAWQGNCSLELGQGYEGSYAAHLDDDSNATQTVSGLDASTTYLLSAQAKAEGGTVTLRVGDQSGQVTTPSYEAVELRVTGSTEYTVTLTHESTGVGYVDNVRLLAQ